MINSIKDVLIVLIIALAVLGFIWEIGQGIAWETNRKDTQRTVCYQQTHNGPYCQELW